MQLLLPEVHASGLWKLKTPYNNFLGADVWYTCIAVRKIEDYIYRGIDPYKEYYAEPFKISEEKYNEDVAAGACIITVRNSSGETKAFPSTYLESFPSGGGVAYQSLALVIELGALPVDYALDDLKAKVQKIVRETIGVEEEAKLVSLATKQLIDRDTHKRYVAAREAKIVTDTQTLVTIDSLTKENEELRKKLQQAETFILNTQATTP